MATDLTGLQVRNTYNSLLKIGDNSNLTGTAKRISDGLGNDSPLFISTSQISIGVAPATGYDLTVNSGIRTGSIDVLGAATAQSLQFNGGGGTQGTMSWNTDEETVDLIQNGATLQLGQETHVHVKNQSGATINDGTPVYVTGTLGASGRLTVAPMIADGSIPAKYFLGVTTEDIPNGEDGKVTTFGKIRGLDTTAYTEGQTLYVSSTTAGFWQTTPPVAPALDLEVAIVINVSANNGTLFVRAQNGYYLGMLHDVYLNSVADNQLLVYNATNSRWENQGIASIGAINLDTVTDNGNTTTNNISVGDINAGNVTLTGYLRGAANFVIDPAAHGDETGVVQILGDLRVDGTTTTINSTTVTIADKNIVLAQGSALPGDANGAGITIDGANASMTYNSTSDRFVFNKDIETNLVGNVTGNLTGDVTGDLNGNADTATTWETARTLTIGDTGKSVDGSSDVTWTKTEVGITKVNIDALGIAASTADLATTSYLLTAEDNRIISPSELDAQRLKFGFTSWNNNNTSPYADFLHLRSYQDQTGGYDNLIMFRKNADPAMRIWTQSWGSTSAYSNYVDVITSATTFGGDVSGTYDNLQVANDSHTHDGRYYTETESDDRFVNVTGDTMTGNLNFTETGGGVTWTMNTDGASIKFYNTGDADTDSRLEFQTTDNNNEYFRWTHKPSGLAAYELMRLTGNGSGGTLDISGEVASNKITVNGTTNNLIIEETTDGEWHIYDTFQDNGIILYSSSGGMEFQYNGSTEMIIDANGVSVIGGIDLSDANLDIGSADIIFGIDATDTGARGLVWNFDADGNGTASNIGYIRAGGTLVGEKMQFNMNAEGTITGGGTVYQFMNGGNDIVSFTANGIVGATQFNGNKASFGSSANTRVAIGYYTMSFESYEYPAIISNNHADLSIGSNIYVNADHDLVNINSHANITGSGIVFGGNGHPNGVSTMNFYAKGGGGSTAGNVYSAESAEMVLSNTQLTLSANLNIKDSHSLLINTHSGTEIEFVGSNAGNISAANNLYLLSQTANTHIGASNTNSLFVVTSGTSYFTNNVGINQTNANADLDVQGTVLIGNGTNSRADLGLTLVTDNSDTFSADTDLSDTNRQFTIINDNATIGAYSSMSFRVYPSSGTAMADIKLVRAAALGDSTLYTTLRDNNGDFQDIMEVRPTSVTINGSLSATSFSGSGASITNVNAATLGGYAISSILSNGTGEYIVHDTRSVDVPTDLGNRSFRFDFKSNGIGGLSDGGAFYSTMTLQQWGDSSGGLTKGLAFTDNGNIYHRTGTIGGSWGGYSLVHSDVNSGRWLKNGSDIYYDSGKVGIGLTGADYNLDVDSDGSAIAINVRARTTTDYSNIRFSSEDGATTLAFIGTRDNHFRILNSSGSENFTILNGGDVGIGVVSPSAKLDVNGNVFVRTGGILFVDTIAGYTSGQVSLNSDTDLIIPSGDVNIGVTSPLLPSAGRGNLSVNGTSDSVVTLGVGGAWSSYYYTNGSATYIASKSGTPIHLEAGGNTKLTIADNGNVGIGIGTSTASTKLEVSGDILSSTGISVKSGVSNLNSGIGATMAVLSDTYAYIDLSTQHTQGSWIDFSKGNGTDYGGRIRYVNGSDYFQFFASGSSSPTMTMKNGVLGINTTNPSTTHKLQVEGRIYANNGTSEALFIDTAVADNNTRDAIQLYENDAQATGRQAISWRNGNQNYYKARLWTEVGGSYNATQFGIDVANDARTLATRLYIRNGDTYHSGDVVAYASDERLKENIRPIENAIDKVKQIKGVHYTWKDEVEDLGFSPTHKDEIGVLAQDVEKVAPEVVRPAPFDYVDGGSKTGENYKTVQYEKLVPLLIEAIKEQQKQIDELKAIINGGS